MNALRNQAQAQLKCKLQQANLAHSFDQSKPGTGAGRKKSIPQATRDRTMPDLSKALPVSKSFERHAYFRKYSWSGRRNSELFTIGEPQLSLNYLELQAICACRDHEPNLKEIHVSELLPRTKDLIFVNVTTLEGVPYCIEITMKGWRICAFRHDSMNGELDKLDLHIRYFGSVQDLLISISPCYSQRPGLNGTERLGQMDPDNVDEGIDCSNTLSHSDPDGWLSHMDSGDGVVGQDSQKPSNIVDEDRERPMNVPAAQLQVC